MERMDRRKDLTPPHGGNQDLRSVLAVQRVHDGTVVFCDRFVARRLRTHDRMAQAARSAVRNIAEGSRAAATSRKAELKLTGVARASLEELLLDYQDFLRQKGLRQWEKDSAEALAVRKKYRKKSSDPSDQCDQSENSDESDLSELYGIDTASAEVAANTLICLIRHASYLLRRQMEKLEEDFLEEDGFASSARARCRGYFNRTMRRVSLLLFHVIR